MAWRVANVASVYQTRRNNASGAIIVLQLAAAQARKSRINFVVGGGLAVSICAPFRRSRRPYGFRYAIPHQHLFGLMSNGKARGAWQKVMKQPEPLCPDQAV